MKKNRFNKFEKEIISNLYQNRRSMSLRELSKVSGSSWVTTKKYAQKLSNKKIIKVYNVKGSKRKKAKFNFNIIK